MVYSFPSCLLPAIVAVALSFVPVASGVAQQFVGLVVEAQGRMEPHIEAFSELAIGTTVRLDGEARLKIAHYHTCEVVSFVGGQIDFSRFQYFARGSKVRVHQRRTCPTRYTLKKYETAGGMIMRFGETITTRPTIVLLGPGAKTIRSIQIHQEQQIVFEVTVEDGKPVWPTSLELTPGLYYRFDFVSSKGIARQATFMARASPSARTTDNLLVVAVE